MSTFTEIIWLYVQLREPQQVEEDKLPEKLTMEVLRKEYPRLEEWGLPAGLTSEHLETLIQKRESRRDFANEPLTLETVSALLGSTRVLDGDRQPERRAYPSAGARFQIELYLASVRVEGLPSGFFHYSPSRHALRLLWSTPLSESTDLASEFIPNAAAVIIMTAVLDRAFPKYGTAALPLALIEVGHIGQNLLLAAGEVAIGACPAWGFDHEWVSSVLDLPTNEVPLYTIGLGRLAV